MSIVQCPTIPTIQCGSMHCSTAIALTDNIYRAGSQLKPFNLSQTTITCKFLLYLGTGQGFKYFQIFYGAFAIREKWAILNSCGNPDLQSLELWRDELVPKVIFIR